jgi:tetratricopeptide (TPR) repeat protein/serine/threonine protein kinase
VNESQIFTNALNVADPAERAAYLDAACASDAQLRTAVEALLQAQANDPDFLERPAASLADTADAPAATATTAPPAERPGLVLAGRYKLLEEVGEGGMGTVWMAQQTEPVKRLVAVKLIKPGMDSKQVLARFEAERQALALMDHPNIAKVHDAGVSPDGRPFFVMELVKGVPITRYCDDHRLTPRQRLELFLPVCHAVQHAHQKGIIHRDLKPSNVLVALYDDRPVPKVIDFGVAKAAGQPLTEQTLHTGFGAVVGTVEYMSPEQATFNQLDVDTRSDVYSLGVLLYELLAGSPPFSKKELEAAGMLEMLRVIREKEPSRPSTKLSTADGLPTLAANRGTEPARLTRQVRGELDWIVMKALEKDRTRRYETANGFAIDIQRYLADEPVLACPPSAGYRLRKFARRNRRGLATAAVLAVALLVAVGAVAGSLGWASRDRAARQATVVARVNQLLDESSTLYGQRKLAGATQIARNALALADGPAGDPEAARRARDWLQDLEMVARLEEIGPGYGPGKPIPDAYGQAFREYGIDIEALTPEEAAARIASRPIRVDLATALDRWGNFVRRHAINLGHFGLDGEKGVALRARLRTIARLADPNELRDRLRDRYAKAAWDDQDIMAIAASVDLASTPIATLMIIGDAYDLPQKISFYARVQQLHPSDFGVTYQLGSTLFWSGDLDRAIRFLTAAVAIRPQSLSARQLLAHTLRNKDHVDEAIAAYRAADRVNGRPIHQAEIGGLLLRQAGREQEAAAEFREALRLASNPMGPAGVHAEIGSAYAAVGKYDDAIASYREAIRLKPDYDFVHHALGFALEQKGLVEEAVAAHREAVHFRPGNADHHNSLGVTLGEAGRGDEAIASYREAVRLMPKQAVYHFNLGNELGKKKEFDAAIVAFREAIRLKPDDAQAHRGLGSALEEKGLLDDAIGEYREAVRLKPDAPGFRRCLGGALKNKGLLIEAIAAYSEAVRIAPKDADAHVGLGSALQKKGLVDDAIGEYREAIRLQPDKALAHHWLGSALEKKGLVEDAIAAYREAIRLQPDLPSLHFGLGSVHARHGQWGPAAAAFARGLKIDKDPNNLRAWYAGLPLQLAAGDPEGYRRLCRQMLERFGQSKDLITAVSTAETCALIPDAVADFKPVEKLADRIVTGTEKHRSYRFFVRVKALVEYRAGRHAEAVQWAERYAPVAGGNEFDAFVFATLSMAQHQLGNADRARAALASAKAIVTSKMPDPANGRPFTVWQEWLHADVLLREAEGLAKEK